MRFKVVFTLILSLVYIGASYSQNPLWIWAESEGGLSNEFGNAVCTDANGNVFVTGTFQGQTFSIGDFTLYNSGEGSLDIFIAKYDEAGNVLWAKSGGGSSDDHAYGICTDSQGNVFITGYFVSSTVSFGTTELSNNSTNSSNCLDIFLTKYDSDGNVVWSRSPVGLGCERARGVAADSEGNVYIVGYFWNDNISFGDHTFIYQGSHDGFIAKYDVNGNVVWAEQIAGSGYDLCEDVFVDAQDNILVTGSFQNEAQFGNNTVVSPNEDTYQEVFAAKFNSEGNNIWAECALVPFNGNYASGNGIASDPEGNVYLTGYFQHSLAFGEDTLGTAGNIAMFLAKYDSSGNALWGRTPGGTGNDYGVDVCVDTDGHIFVTGYFQSSFLNFGGFPLINSNTGFNETFVAGYDVDGDALWATAIGGQDDDYGMSLGSGPDNNVYLTGYFGSYSLDFSNTTVVNSGSYDMYLAKLSHDVALTVQTLGKPTEVGIFPNPFYSTVNIVSDGPTTIEIYDMSSRKVFEHQFTNTSAFDLSELAGGIYLYKCNRQGTVSTGKMIKK